MAEDYRERLLGFLRSRAVGDAGELLVEDPAPPPSSAPAAGDHLAERFRSELSAVGGDAVDLTASSDPAAELGSWLSGLGLESAVIDSDPAWSRLALPVKELIVSAGLSVDSVDSSATPSELARYDLGVTLADAAIAETGTIATIANTKTPSDFNVAFFITLLPFALIYSTEALHAQCESYPRRPGISIYASD